MNGDGVLKTGLGDLKLPGEPSSCPGPIGEPAAVTRGLPDKLIPETPETPENPEILEIPETLANVRPGVVVDWVGVVGRANSGDCGRGEDLL